MMRPTFFVALILVVGCSSSGSDPKVPPATDTGGLEASTSPDTSEADVPAPVEDIADVAQPDAVEPDAAEPDAAEPDATEPDVSEPDVALPDVADDDVPAPPDVVDGEMDQELPEAPDEGADVPTDGPTNLLASGWSFGECMGACKADLVFEGASLQFTQTGWDGTVYQHAKGLLTTGAAAELEALLIVLEDAPLKDVYGCPDCADGGASYITLMRKGVTTTHKYEYGKPPMVLADLDELVSAAALALKTCTGNGIAILSGECSTDAP